MNAQFPVGQYSGGFTITPSDTVDIKDDVANLEGVGNVFVHNPSTGGTLRVMPAGQKLVVGFTLTGSSGTATITINGVAYTATYSSSLTVTAAAFVSTYGKTLKELNIKVRSTGAVLIFDGVMPNNISIANATGDLNGTVLAPTPVTIYLAQGQTSEVAVSRVYAGTPTPPSNLVGLYSGSK